jgi:hypothetical protein
MNKQITFFWDRRQSGYTYDFPVEDGGRIYKFSVFSRKALDEKALPKRKENKGSIEPQIENLRSMLSQGGVIALIYEENRAPFLRTIPVASQPESATSSVGLLLPGQPSLNLEALGDSKGVSFPARAHALIPVDATAEKHLSDLQKQLRYLPADLEALVLHSIRDPSLEARVGLLEAINPKGLAGQQSGKSWILRGLPFLSKLPWFERSVPAWPVAMLLVLLLLVGNGMLSYSILESVNGSFVIPGLPRARATEGEGPAASGKKIFGLIDAVRAQETNPNLVALAVGHFAKVENEEDLEVVLRPGDEGELLVRGLLKLEAHRLEPSDATLFASANNPSAVNKFYKDRTLDQDSQDMLAALACAAFGTPGLPKTSTETAVLFAETDQRCESFPLDKASAGLDRLLEHIQKPR